MANKFFKLTHEYDIGDRSIYFVFDESKAEVTAKELAVFLQFKAENVLHDCIDLDHPIIMKFLALFGAEQIKSIPANAAFITIDMFWDREECCGDWYNNIFGVLDKKYSEKATTLLKNV